MATPKANINPAGSGPFFHADKHEVEKGHSLALGGNSWNCKECGMQFDPDEVYSAENQVKHLASKVGGLLDEDPNSLKVRRPEPTEQLVLPAGSVAVGERLAKQVKHSSRWLSAAPEAVAGEFAHRGGTVQTDFYSEGEYYGKPHAGVWVTSSGRYPSGVAIYVANKLVGDSRVNGDTPLDAYDLYSSYKNTPHAPASVFLKYLVHRHNNVEAYDDPEQGHALDKQFLGLVQGGGAGDKNKHVSVQDLHEWTARHATTVMPQLLAIRAKLHGEIARGVGLNKRYINGEPHIALSRGLNSDTMKNEHPLSSHADKPDTGFGSDMHHAWVPLKDVWYSYDLGHVKSHNNMGPEDEWLVSNTSPRYEAAAHDVHKGRMRQWDSDSPRIYDDMQDAELASLVDQQFAPGMPSRGSEVVTAVRNHPNAGPAVFQAMDRHTRARDNIPAGTPIVGHFGHHWYPPEQVMAAAANVRLLDSPAWLRNPGLTSANLEALAPKAFMQEPRHPQAREVVDMLVHHPSMNSHVLERIARTQHGSPWLAELLRAPVATHQMREDALAQVEFGAFQEPTTADGVLLAVVENPHHTEEQARRAYDWCVKQGGFSVDSQRQIPLLNLCKHAKLPEDIVRGMRTRLLEMSEESAVRNAARGWMPNGHRTPEEAAEMGTLVNALSLITHTNPNSGKVLARLAEEGHFDFERVYTRIGYQDSKLDPELQPAFIRAASHVPERREALETLAYSKKLTPESIKFLANYQEPTVRAALFHNKHITPEQIREAYPKSFPFPETDPMAPGGKSYPFTESRTADDIAAAYWRRKNYAQKRLVEHFIKPLPQDLAKSSVDLWQAQARSWLEQQGTTGFYLLTHKDLADGILRDKAIEPQFTEELLEGEAVIGLPARPVNLEKLRRMAGPDDVVLYFETEVEPQEQSDGAVYWTARVPCETVHIADVGDQPLAKFHTPLTFPKLGVGDDRRETKVVDSPLKRKTFFRAAAAQGVRENFTDPEENERLRSNSSYREQVMDRETKSGAKLMASGATYEGLAGEGHPGYQTPREERERIPGAGTGQHAISATFTLASMPRRKVHPQIAEEFRDPRNVGQVNRHEDLHRVFSRIQHLHGEKERQTLARNLVMALPQDLRSAMMVHLFYAQPKYQTHPHPEEEAITELGSYLNQPQVRDRFHQHQQHTSEKQKAFHDKMKRAYRLLQAIAPTVDVGWLHQDRPWMKKGEALHKFHEPQGPAGLSAQAAHAVFLGSNKLSKSHPDLVDPNLFAFRFETDPKLYDAVVARHTEVELRKGGSADIVLPGETVFKPGEESAARAFLGHNKTHETHLAAARFLVGRREPVDEDMFRLALSVYDGDHERAALIAVGLTDSEQNLRALRAALKLGEFSPDLSRELTKNEPGTPHIETVNPGAPDAQETAAQVQRAVTAGLVQPLKLGGKHSKGAMAARDPKTGNVWLMKPGSGKQSPAAGARDDSSSQSAREAAFWHCADRVGLGNYYPRADLLEVNGAQVAAMKLLGTQWKGLDEANRKVDGYAREVLQPYLDRGDVHRLAALDWILGNPDSHGQNVMVHAEAVALIDHGSAFAGPNFAPGKDSKSFTPYYLRVFAPGGYAKKKPEDRVRGLPRLGPVEDAALRKWLRGIDPAILAETMGSHGIGETAQKAVLARLGDLQRYAGPNLSEHLNGLWAGV